MQNTVLLTGVIRSGTTLSCALLNELPNVLVLDEPLQLKVVQQLDQPAFMLHVEEEFAAYRQQALVHKTAYSGQLDQQLAQHYTDDKNEEGLRASVISYETIAINKDLSPDFTLVVKHHVVFLKYLEALMKKYPVYGLVRNPLSVLLSTHTLATLHKGYYQHQDKFLPELIASIREKKNKTERLIKLLDFFFASNLPLLEAGQTLYYEDLVANSGQVLSHLVPAAAAYPKPLRNFNTNPYLNREQTLVIGEQLLKSEGAFWHFYSKDTVRELLDQLLAQ